MRTPTVDDLLVTWTQRAVDGQVGEHGLLGRAVLDRLADGIPADAEHLTHATGLPREAVARRINDAAAAGYEVEDGAIVGAALTLNPTPHAFRVRGNDLFTWCGFDALFLPRLLAARAEVGSTCPITGEHIRLAVEADGAIHDVTPTTTVVAVVGAEIISCCDTTGPDSDVCTQMPFLSSPDAADAWVQGRSGVALVDLHTASDVARRYAEQLRSV